MRKTNKDRTPPVKPIEKIVLSEDHTKRKTILLCVFLAVAVTAFGLGLFWLLGSDTGWQTIEVDSYENTCGTDFTFRYHVTDSGISASAQYKAVSAFYNEACRTAFRLFDSVEHEGSGNLGTLNAHINEAVPVSSVIYRALQTAVSGGDRTVFSSPIYDSYLTLFGCHDDLEAASCDPFTDESTQSYFAQVLPYINSETHISLTFLEDNFVQLSVSDAYLDFASENGITAFLDFVWLKNAFVVDFLADTLSQKGYTNGILSSYDGFVRNLDTGDTDYTVDLINKVDTTLYQAGQMNYSGGAAIVFLRNYPINSLDDFRFYVYEDKTVRSPYIDTADGFSKSSVNEIYGFSKQKGCAQILMSLLPFYITDSLVDALPHTLSENGIDYVRFENRTVYYTGEVFTLSSLLQDENISYNQVKE